MQLWTFERNLALQKIPTLDVTKRNYIVVAAIYEHVLSRPLPWRTLWKTAFCQGCPYLDVVSSGTAEYPDWSVVKASARQS